MPSTQIKKQLILPSKNGSLIQMPNNRQFHRVDFDCLIEFESKNCQHVCELIDISLQGALIASCSNTTPDAGTLCKLTINLNESKSLQIVMIGNITRTFENSAGIQCKYIDADSMSHLRKLVGSNLGDTELVNRDFDTLLMNHR